MKKQTLIKLGAITLAAGLTVNAVADDGMSYSFIEAAYIDTEIDDGPIDVDGDGFGLKGSLELGEIAFVTASYGTQDFDLSVDLDQWSVGVGGHLPIAENIDLVGTLSYIDAEIDTPFGDADDDGYGAGVGIRARLAEQFEVEGGINYVDLDDSGDDTSFALGGRYYISPEFAVGAGFQIGDDVTAWNIGVRVEF